MFAKALLETSVIYFNLFVVYGTKIKGRDFEQDHSQEADTLLPYQVLASVDEVNGIKRYVFGHQTQTYSHSCLIVSHGRLGSHSICSLKFLTGKGVKYRDIDVVDRVKVIGHGKCQGLIGLHNFTGADWGGKFVGITKKTWITEYLKLCDDDPVITCFRELGDSHVAMELIGKELPENLRPLEHFVCRVYRRTGPTTLPPLRCEMFRSKNLEGEICYHQLL